MERLHRRIALAFAGVAAGLALAPAGALAGDWTSCGPQLECAHVPVPLDWAQPGGRTITLSVIRRPAGTAGRLGSLFVNPGGPGESGVADVRRRGGELAALTGGRFDVVSWDIRGSWDSARVSCFARPAERARFWGARSVPTTAAERAGYLAKTTALAGRCAARNGELLAHISTADTARDLDHLRALVGDPQLTFLGDSMGTLIGETYANLFPGRVRAMALDGVEDPMAFGSSIEDMLASSLVDADRLFARFAALCEAAGPERCALAGHGSVARRLEALLARLRRHPLPVPGGALTYSEALTAIKIFGLPQPGLWPELARQLEAAARGNGTDLDATAAIATSEEFRRDNWEVESALLCADSPARHGAGEWPAAMRRLGRVSRIGAAPMGWLVGAPCAAWRTPSAAPYTGPWNVPTANPILLIGTRVDPNTPLINAQRVERELGNAVLLTHEGYGHLSSADPSTCVEQAIGAYFINLTIPARGAVCAADHEPFDADFPVPEG